MANLFILIRNMANLSCVLHTKLSILTLLRNLSLHRQVAADTLYLTDT